MGKERESANLVSTLTGIAVTLSGDPVVLGIGSTEHLRLHDDGRIGFGTNSAIAKLDIRGGVTQDGGEECLLVASSDPLNIPSTITTGYSYGTLQVFGGGMAGSSLRGGQIDFIGGSSSVTGIDTGALLFRTGLTTAGGTSQPERVRISAAGLVGIGTTGPATPLSVAIGSSTFEVHPHLDSGATLTSFNRTSNSWQDLRLRGYSIKFSPQGNEKARVNSDGRFGIGTTNPNALLTVAASGASAQIEIQRTNTNTSGAIGALNFTAIDGHSVANIQALGDGNDEGAHLVFKTTSAATENSPYGSGTIERVRINSAGRVGIGTDNPNSFLHVQGDSANTLFRLKRTDAPAQILNDFGSGDSALKYTVNNASSYILGVDDSDADRFKLSFGSSDDAAFGTNDLVSVTTAGNLEVDSGDLTLNGNLVGAINVTVADDAFASITPPREGGGWVFITTRGQGSTYPWSTGYGFAYMDWGASAQVSAATLGASVETSTAGPPNGTTGSDEHVTIFTGGTGGTLYLENRLGDTYSFQLTFI